MPYKNVEAPTKGLVTVIPSTMLEEEMSPSMAGVILKDGEVSSDYGTVQYPIPGVLKTNALNGIFMRADPFDLTSGVQRLVALTTTNAYEYNTSTTTWDCITKGQTIEDCEDAWVAKTNVTSTADSSVKLRGTNSSKNVIAADFTTGIATTEDFSSLDLSAESGVHFWIYSTIATAAGDLQLLLDDTSACASALETLSVPALAANTWTPVYIAYATPGNLTAIISVGLNVAVDNGAQTVYLDDIRSVDAFTGTASNLFSVWFLNDTMLITNGVNQPQKYGGTAATGLLDLGTNLAAGAITTSEIIITAKDHVVLMNNTENGGDAPLRASWSNIGKIDDYIGGTAGYQDLTDDESWIISAEQLSSNTWAIYKERSIIVMEWVGGQTPFRFTTMVKGQTCAGKACVLNVDGVHFVIGLRDIYKYTGDNTTTRLDTKIKRDFFNAVNYTMFLRAFILYIESEDELQFWIPTAADYPDIIYCLDRVLEIWYRKTRTMTGWGTYQSASSLTIGDLVGTIGDQNFTFGSTVTKTNTPIFLVGDSSGSVYQLSKTTYNNNGTAITNEFQTPDFVYPTTKGIKASQDGTLASAGGEYEALTFRVTQLLYEARGQSMETHWSDDGGLTWNPTQGDATHIQALTSVYKLYQQDMDAVVRKIRFRFKNSIVSSSFTFRYYGFYYLPRSSQ